MHLYSFVVHRPREQAVDAEVFAHLTSRTVELAKKLEHGCKVCARQDIKVRWAAVRRMQERVKYEGTFFQYF